MKKQLKYYDLSFFKTRDSLLELLEKQLLDLSEIAGEMDFSHADDNKRFKESINYLRRYFYHYEMIVRNEQNNS